MGKWGKFSIVEELEFAALSFERKGKDTEAVLQDFLSFRQALNVASADQRLLVFVDGGKAATRKLTPTLQKLFADEDIIGRTWTSLARKITNGAKSLRAQSRNLRLTSSVLESSDWMDR